MHYQSDSLSHEGDLQDDAGEPPRAVHHRPGRKRKHHHLHRERERAAHRLQVTVQFTQVKVIRIHSPLYPS